MIKFKDDLEGYGFDVSADRLVRFNKYPDGTYLNTRATYSINKKQFTHFELRSRALKEDVTKPIIQIQENKKRRKFLMWVCIFVFLFTVLVNSEFELSFTKHTTSETQCQP